MSPKLQALKEALARMDAAPEVRFAEARKAMLAAATAAGFDHAKVVETWARYQVAVGEAHDQLAEIVEPEPESRELFG